MSLFDLIPDIVWQFLDRLFKPIAGPIKGVISIFRGFKDNTVGIFTEGLVLVEKVQKEYQAMKNFKLKPQWQNRVISVPDAIDNIKKLVEVPDKVLTAIKDLIKQLRDKLPSEAFNVEELEGVDDLEGLLKRFGPKVARGAEKMIGALSLIVDTLVSIRKTITDLEEIVDAVTEVRKDLDHLDGVFLPQNNSRKKWKLAPDLPQKSVNVRLGSRHGG